MIQQLIIKLKIKGQKKICMRTNKDKETLQKIKLVMSKVNLRYSLRKCRGNGGDETYY